MELRSQRMPPGLAERSSKMYILPMLTHLEVVALGDRSDISPDQHLNYASNAAAWPAGVVPGLSASAQGAATQALQRRHSGALSRAKSAMCCCGGWLAVRRPGPGARSWGAGGSGLPPRRHPAHLREPGPWGVTGRWAPPRTPQAGERPNSRSLLLKIAY